MKEAVNYRAEYPQRWLNQFERTQRQKAIGVVTVATVSRSTCQRTKQCASQLQFAQVAPACQKCESWNYLVKSPLSRFDATASRPPLSSFSLCQRIEAKDRISWIRDLGNEKSGGASGARLLEVANWSCEFEKLNLVAIVCKLESA